MHIETLLLLIFIAFLYYKVILLSRPLVMLSFTPKISFESFERIVRNLNPYLDLRVLKGNYPNLLSGSIMFMSQYHFGFVQIQMFTYASLFSSYEKTLIYEKIAHSTEHELYFVVSRNVNNHLIHSVDYTGYLLLSGKGTHSSIGTKYILFDIPETTLKYPSKNSLQNNYFSLLLESTKS